MKHFDFEPFSALQAWAEGLKESLPSVHVDVALVFIACAALSLLVFAASNSETFWRWAMQQTFR